MNAITQEPSRLVQTVNHVFARLWAGLAGLAREDDRSLNAADLRRLAEEHASQPSFASDLLAAAELAAAREKC